MSRQKPDKFASKLSGCFPVKGCLQRRPPRRPVGTIAAEQPVLGPGLESAVEARMEHTKQWLQNLSTVVNYDTTILGSPSGLSDVTCHADGSYVGWNDSPDSADRTLQGCGEKDCCCKKNAVSEKQPLPTKSHGDVKHSENTHKNCRCGNDSSIVSDIKPKFDDSVSGSDVKGKMGNSSYMSTSTVANSSALSSKCCSQHRHRSRRHILSSTAMHTNGACSNSLNDCSSIASSSVSLTTELVTLNLNEGRPLGITIVGHSSGQRGGDCGIFVGCVKRGGAAAADGRIEPGDLILEVNGIDLEGLSNERALTILRSELARGGMVQILVAKYWDMEDPEDCNREPIYEPVGSVRSSVAGSKQGPDWGIRPGPLKAIPEDSVRPRLFREASGASNSESDRASNSRFSSLPPVARPLPGCHVVPAASMPSLSDQPHYVSRSHSATRHSTIERARGCQAIPQAPSADEPFLGAELVNWIRCQVAGLSAPAEALSYANELLQAGYIYTVNRPHQQNGATRFYFREDDYYVFGRSWDESDTKRPTINPSGAYL